MYWNSFDPFTRETSRETAFSIINSDLFLQSFCGSIKGNFAKLYPIMSGHERPFRPNAPTVSFNFASSLSTFSHASTFASAFLSGWFTASSNSARQYNSSSMYTSHSIRIFPTEQNANLWSVNQNSVNVFLSIGYKQQISFCTQQRVLEHYNNRI